MYEQFTNKYKLSKTLSFSLIPQGDTLKHIEANGILEEDGLRAEEAKEVKRLASEYHKTFIDRVLKDLRLQGIETYEHAFFDADSDNAGKVLDETAAKMRRQISEAFKKDPGFKDMFSGKMYSEILPEYFAKDPSAIASLSLFDKFTSYFRHFNTNRSLMYDASSEKGTAKKGTIACRIVDENLPVFLSNSRNAEIILNTISGIEADVQKDLGFLLQGETLSAFFRSDNYNAFITQKGIDRYNQMIGGYSTEDGEKIKGINEYINMYNQNAEKKEKLPFLVKLKKQILSDRTTVSFIPEAFRTDEELINAVLTFDETCTEPIISICSLIENIRDYDMSSIYISKDLVKEVSNKACGSWHYIFDLLSEEYDRNSGVSEKKRSAKAYEKKKKKALDSVKAYSVGKLDEMPGIDGKVSKYLIGAAGFGKSGVEIARKGMLKHLDARDENAGKSLRRDKPAKAAIKDYLDACQDIRRLAACLITEAPGKDYAFYEKLETGFEDMSAVRALYNKARNYLSGKLYTNEQIKLNFKSGQFLDGWAESVEKMKLGTILIRDDSYYLGIIAKGQGDLFAKIPDAKTEDVYRKMRYNIISGANKTLPHIAFSAKGREKFRPGSSVLRIYKEETFIKKRSSFSLEDCHSLIDFYKDCISSKPDWECFDFSFSPTESYEDISGFFREVEDAGYSLKFRNIDRSVIDDLVSSGRLYLFKINCKDFSPRSKGKPNLFTLYWKAVFDESNLEDPQVRLNGGAEMFYRKASIREEDIVRHKKGDVVKAKNPLSKTASRTLDYDIIKDRRFCFDHFELHVPVTFNAKAPDFCYLNTEAMLAVKNADDPHVIGVSRGENSLVHITVLDSKGNIVESRSLNVIESAAGDTVCRTDYASLLAKREAERDAQRKSWETVEGIKNLKEAYVGQVVHVLADLMIKYDAVIAIEDLNMRFKQSRQKIEKAVYQKLEEKLLKKLNFLVCKDADPNEPGGIYKGYQLTLPFQSFDRIGQQTGFIFYISPWKTTEIDPSTGFINLFYTKYTNLEDAFRFWRSFDSVTYDEAVGAYRFDFDYRSFGGDDAKKKLLDGTKTSWSIYVRGKRLAPVKDDKGVRYVPVDINEAISDLFKEYDIGRSEDIREEIASVKKKEFHEKLLDILRLTVSLRNGSEIISPVMDENGNFYTGAADENGSYNIARKGLLLMERIRSASEEDLTLTGKGALSMSVSGNEWLKFVQGRAL